MQQKVFTDYKKAKKQVLNLKTNYKGFNLENMLKAYKLLGKPCNKKFCIHVTGSNGKGSVSTLIYYALLENNKKTGLYTSPHLVGLRERIQFNGRKISKKEFLFYANKLFSINNSCIKKLTQFEVLTLIALLCFQEKTGFVVLEIGLGGKLDATNIVGSQAQVITSISLEHTNYLGKTKKKILMEKMGVIKNKSIVIASIPTNLFGLIEQKCRQKKCRLFLQGKDFFYRFLKTGFETGTIIEYKQKNPEKTFLLKTRMLGLFQANNLAIAFTLLNQIKKRVKLKKQKILKGLKKAFIPGRMQLFEKNNKKILFDAAHNPEGAKMLFKSIELIGFKPEVIVCGFSFDKNIKKMVFLVLKKTKKVVITKSGYRACDPKKILKEFKKQNSVKTRVLSPEKALIYCTKRYSKILVFGSIYLAEKVFLWLSKNGFKPKKCKDI